MYRCIDKLSIITNGASRKQLTFVLIGDVNENICNTPTYTEIIKKVYKGLLKS